MTPDQPPVPSKRVALRAFVASIVASALLGIWALLSGDFSELQVKVLLSSLSVSAATLCALSCAALFEARGERGLSVPGMVLSAVGLVLVLLGMWAEIEEEGFWKLTSATCFFAAAFAHGSLVRLARMTPRHAWVGTATIGAAMVLAAFGSFMVLLEEGDEWTFRLLGVLSILVAAGSLATPVLHRLGRDEPRGDAAPLADGRVPMLCPDCSHRFEHALGDVRCPRCGGRFSIARLAV